MSDFWFFVHVLLIVVAIVAAMGHSLSSDRRMVFTTKNKGRTFWYKGKEMRPSKLTDSLQDAHKKHTAYEWSSKKWQEEDFYNDND